MTFWLYPVVELNIPESIQKALRDCYAMTVSINGRFLCEDEYAVALPKLALGIPVAVKSSDYLTLRVDALGLCWEHFRGEWKDVGPLTHPHGLASKLQTPKPASEKMR